MVWAKPYFLEILSLNVKILILSVLAVAMIGLMVPSTFAEEKVPTWIKNNAGWWAEGQIDDNSFVQGIEYLVKVGIIKVT